MRAGIVDSSGAGAGIVGLIATLRVSEHGQEAQQILLVGAGLLQVPGGSWAEPSSGR